MFYYPVRGNANNPRPASNPFFKAAPPVRRDYMERGPAVSLLKSVQVPFAQIKRVIAVVIQHMGDRPLTRFQLPFVGNDGFIGVEACQLTLSFLSFKPLEAKGRHIIVKYTPLKIHRIYIQHRQRKL